MGKTPGMGAGRKLKTNRRNQMWADKAYNKSHLGNDGIEAKQPNSAIRKCARDQLVKNTMTVVAFVPNDGCLNCIKENDKVLIAGFGRRRYSGCPFQVMKASGVSLLALFKEKKKPRSVTLFAVPSPQ